jgi:hypothetical protein
MYHHSKIYCRAEDLKNGGNLLSLSCVRALGIHEALTWWEMATPQVTFLRIWTEIFWR